MSYKLDFVSDDQLSFAMFAYTKVLSPSIQTFALLSNVFNIVTFGHIGFKDAVNVTFLALSLSDLAYVILDMADTVCLNAAMSPWQQNLPVSLHSICGGINYYPHIFMDSSVGLETYLAIVRCCCVVMPLRFKNVFTLQRSALIIAFIFLCNIVYRIPLLSSYKLTWQAIPGTNQTRLTFLSTSDFKLFNWIEQIFSRTVFPVILFFVAALCTVILATSLVRASSRRRLMTHAPTTKRRNSNSAESKAFAAVKESPATLNTKEVQLVKAVTLVTVLLGILLLVYSVFSLAQAAVPDFFPRQKYNNIHGVVTVTVSLFTTAHAGCKIFIYYYFNSRFRSTLKQCIFGVSDKDSPIRYKNSEH